MAARVRQPSTVPTSTPSRTELPGYEAPTFPLNPAAQRALAQLAHKHSLKQLGDSLNEAIKTTRTAAGDVNERLAEREREVKKRRINPGGSQDAAHENGDDVERKLEELREKVDRMTQRMDDSVRKTIDGMYSVNFIETSLVTAVEEASANASTQASSLQTRPRRSGRNADAEEGSGQDEEYQEFDPTDPEADTQTHNTPIELFRTQLDIAKTRYQSHSMKERYADNNDYRDFKRTVHHSRYPDEDVPMQHQNNWFNEDQVAAIGVTKQPRLPVDSQEEDDDIAVLRANISTKCPLTLQEFVQPLSSRICPHSFEAKAILEMVEANRIGARQDARGRMIGGTPGVQCPVQGCSKELTRNNLYTDDVLLRRLNRLRRARELEEEESDDGGNISGTQGRVHVIEDEDEDGVNVDDLSCATDHGPGTQWKVEPTTTALRSRDVMDLSGDENDN